MMQVCNSCGRQSKILIRCKRCDTKLCKFCFNFTLALCNDCIIEEYDIKYQEKIKKYHEGVKVIA